ncbi:MAG: hypothetical protein UU81_C0012G0012 [Microgenomates group bacterium GW2011_GWC1_41_8]|uniref:Uncharacterized protein n=2 Tax=Candidatus Roizmaniibacteriota TaxID=1752723 RepID=A0A0G0T6R9_9BACT|nr:MAG: hypothetical protein UU14_C0049G0005 [Candidatus Roizmanbacteria bacterium GW2011_GWB1_40_7]KKR91498.1 MAG: hypothetical protein UU41_C0036G0005 [Candidatus Roizmanbacteria bacterium GW2011_GWA1_41_13]KKS24143.1 MAG: hypothetical protein UU81_C0012G0012 [Microgenomates group bacterium GW2011_GWC1_41_8]OGK49652.1 MAG: hypothetical protein A3A55_02690 [Candidatus Roizmanbacteria bacterium RIFCSPLOWO2_01_FULL_40_14]
MPIENPRRTAQNALTIVNPVELADVYGDFFLDLPYRIYSSNRLDGNSDGAVKNFDRLYSTLSERMGGAPYQGTVAGTGMVGSRDAVVQIHHSQDAVSTKRGIQITFPDDPTKIYFFGDGAHIVTVDPRINAILTHKVRRDQDAHKLMNDLLNDGRPS